MSRSGYSDDYGDEWSRICWRGAVASSLRGKRGQSFLREMLASLDALPAHELISGELVKEGEACAIGECGSNARDEHRRHRPGGPQGDRGDLRDS